MNKLIKMNLNKKFKQYLVNVSLLIITFIIFLLISEFFLDLVYPQKGSKIFLEKGAEDNFDPIVGWTDYKSSKYRYKSQEFDNIIRINNEGFRDDNWEIQKNFNEKRIVALGDSFTHAIEVDKDNIFTEILESMLNLNSSNYSFSVLNFGIGGYSVCNEYFVLLNKSLKYAPDLVILFFYIGNDFYEHTDSLPRRPKCEFDADGNLIEYTKPTNIKRKDDNLLDTLVNTNIGMLLMNTLRYSPISYRIGKIFGKEPHYETVDLFDINKQNQTKNIVGRVGHVIKGMDVLLKSRNISFIVVIIPHRIQVQKYTWEDILSKYNYNKSNYNLTIPNRLLIEYLEYQNITYLDLYIKFRDISNEGPLYFYHNGHLNKKGHNVLAGEVYNFIKSKKIID